MQSYIEEQMADPALGNATHKAAALGWDTVFAVSYTDINDAIVQRKSTPDKLNSPPKGPLKFGVTADFGAWQMFPGGDGDSVHFLLPMTNLKASYVLNGQPGQVTCAQATMTVEVKLALIPHPGQATYPDGSPIPDPKPGTKRHALKLRDKGTGPKDPVASIVNVDYIKPLSDPQANTPIRTCLDDWVLTQIQVFEHIFAFIDLNDQIDHGDFAFTKPRYTSYAVCDTLDKSSGFMAVLSMTTADPTPQIQQVATYAIPSGDGASFLIRSKRFLLDMIMPGLLAKWPNLKRNMLEMSKDCSSFTLKDGVHINLPEVNHDGDTYTPELLSFHCEILGNELIVSAGTQVEVHSGIYGTCFSTNYYELFIDKNKKGKQIINYRESRKPSVHKGHWNEPGIDIAKTVLMVIGFVLGLVLIVLTDGAAAVVMCALLIVMIGVFIITEMKDDALDAAPGLDDLIKNFTGPVVWTSKAMKIKSAGLHGSLQLGGNFS